MNMEETTTTDNASVVVDNNNSNNTTPSPIIPISLRIARILYYAMSTSIWDYFYLGSLLFIVLITPFTYITFIIALNGEDDSRVVTLSKMSFLEITCMISPILTIFLLIGMGVFPMIPFICVFLLKLRKRLSSCEHGLLHDGLDSSLGILPILTFQERLQSCSYFFSLSLKIFSYIFHADERDDRNKVMMNTNNGESGEDIESAGEKDYSQKSNDNLTLSKIDGRTIHFYHEDIEIDPEKEIAWTCITCGKFNRLQKKIDLGIHDSYSLMQIKECAENLRMVITTPQEQTSDKKDSTKEKHDVKQSNYYQVQFKGKKYHPRKRTSPELTNTSYTYQHVSCEKCFTPYDYKPKSKVIEKKYFYPYAQKFITDISKYQHDNNLEYANDDTEYVHDDLGEEENPQNNSDNTNTSNNTKVGFFYSKLRTLNTTLLKGTLPTCPDELNGEFLYPPSKHLYSREFMKNHMPNPLEQPPEVSLTVGTLIESNQGRNSDKDWYPGIIVKCLPNKKYNILWDNGVFFKCVDSSHIRLHPRTLIDQNKTPIMLCYQNFLRGIWMVFFILCPLEIVRELISLIKRAMSQNSYLMKMYPQLVGYYNTMDTLSDIFHVKDLPPKSYYIREIIWILLSFLIIQILFLLVLQIKSYLKSWTSANARGTGVYFHCKLFVFWSIPCISMMIFCTQFLEDSSVGFVGQGEQLDSSSTILLSSLIPFHISLNIHIFCQFGKWNGSTWFIIITIPMVIFESCWFYRDFPTITYTYDLDDDSVLSDGFDIFAYNSETIKEIEWNVFLPLQLCVLLILGARMFIVPLLSER